MSSSNAAPCARCPLRRTRAVPRWCASAASTSSAGTAWPVWMWVLEYAPPAVNVFTYSSLSPPPPHTGWLSVAALRQGSLQEQIGSFACLGCLASRPSYWHICWLWYSSAGRIAAAAAGGAMHYLLQVPWLQWLQDRRGRCGAGGGGDRIAGLIIINTDDERVIFF